MTRLDDAIARARTLEVRDEGARQFVAELSQWAGKSEPARARWPWFAGGVALAAAAAVLLLVVRESPRPVEPSAIRLGDRVAIVVAPSTQYRVVATDEERTVVEVTRGTVTARLWPGARAYRLGLRGGGVEAVATGTVFALRVDDDGASVEVHEGHVAVSRGDDHVEVAATTAWPHGGVLRSSDDARRLLAMPAVSAAAPEPELARLDAGVADASAEPTDAAVILAAPHRDAAAATPPIERWRRARLLRSQGKFEAALAECIEIADAKDATWSPIALLEAARIELGPNASPERAIALAERFASEWPDHALAPEARDLRCRALKQLGRDAECGAP
ncbi:MAG: hypothetical protein HOV81_42340 [Kofleriaceae bacterium]|nr:hypothetical protein [Kofleriaceae bacterium]